NATGYVPSSLDKAAFYGVQVDQDLFDPVKSRFVPAGSDSMMPVVKDPLMSGQRGGGGENVVRQVVVVPFSSDRPGDRQQTHTVQSSPTGPPSTMASTPEMQDEMRKLIAPARSAVADLQPAARAGPAAEPPAQAPAASLPAPSPQAALIASSTVQRRPPPAQPGASAGEGPAPIAAVPVPPAPPYPTPESSAQAAQ